MNEQQPEAARDFRAYAWITRTHPMHAST